MPNRPRVGFTLIELLVVISVISLLIAILLPALNSARNTARNLQSTSNVRQIAVAAYAYSNDNDGAVPPRVAGTMFGWAGKAGQVGGYFNLKPDERPLNDYLAGGRADDDAEFDYLRAPNDRVEGAFGSTAESLYDAAGSSYAANVGGNSDPWTYAGSSISGLVTGSSGTDPQHGNSLAFCKTISQIDSPSEFVILGEEGAFFHGWSWNNPRFAPADRYWYAPDAPKWNLAFGDGHAGVFDVQPGETWGDGFAFSDAKPPSSYVQP